MSLPLDSGAPRARPGGILRVSLADSMYEAVLTDLLSGRIQPGTALNIDALAREFAVSPTPVREALARLEATGLVEREVLRGYRASQLPSVRDLSDLMDARALLEPELARLTAIRMEPGLLESLGSAVDAHSALLGARVTQEYRRYWEADESFHRLIAQACGNRSLEAAYGALGGHLQRFRVFGAPGVSDAAEAVNEHREILAMLRAGDAEGSAAAMSSHICRVKERTLADRRAVDSAATGGALNGAPAASPAP